MADPALWVNDFPAEPIYTLVVDGVALVDLDHWPDAWPGPPRRPPLVITPVPRRATPPTSRGRSDLPAAAAPCVPRDHGTHGAAQVGQWVSWPRTAPAGNSAVCKLT